jgi:hypothetical protein
VSTNQEKYGETGTDGAPWFTFCGINFANNEAKLQMAIDAGEVIGCIMDEPIKLQ